MLLRLFPGMVPGSHFRRFLLLRYDLFALAPHTDVFKKEKNAGIILLYFPKNTDVFKEKHTSGVVEIKLLSGKAEPLTRRAAYKEVYMGKVGGVYFSNASELQCVREIVLRLRYGVFVYLGSVVFAYLDSGLPQRNLPAAHTVEKTKDGYTLFVHFVL